MSSAKTNSRTTADTITGEHEHTICGYSLLKGIGDGEPVASDRFSVGGHDWVLLFYPDGKKSSNSDAHVDPRVAGVHIARDNEGNNPNGDAAGNRDARGDARGDNQPAGVNAHQAGGQNAPEARRDNAGGGGMPGNQPPNMLAALQNGPGPQLFLPVPAAQPGGGVYHYVQRPGRRNDSSNEYCALFVALIGEGPDPQGVINTTDGKVVRAFHRFTLVDQVNGRDITKGRHREDGAVKISCARQDPNARNCHGYRKFVKKSVLEDPSRGFLLEDRIVIRYTIDLVVSQGGALTASKQPVQKQIDVPPLTIGADFGALLDKTDTADITFRIVPQETDLPSVSTSGARDEEQTSSQVTLIKAHKLVLQARVPVFETMLSSEMREGETGEVTITDMLPDVFRVLLYFIYADDLPAELRDNKMDTSMAQHLLMAADRYQLGRLRAMAERRLCETLDIETVSTTLVLADKSNASNLRKVCLSFTAQNLNSVIQTVEYARMTEACPDMVKEILNAVASQGNPLARSAPSRRIPVSMELHDRAQPQHRRVRQRRDGPEAPNVPMLPPPAGGR